MSSEDERSSSPELGSQPSLADDEMTSEPDAATNDAGAGAAILSRAASSASDFELEDSSEDDEDMGEYPDHDQDTQDEAVDWDDNEAQTDEKTQGRLLHSHQDDRQASPLKRGAPDPMPNEERPLKRAKGAFNHDYLALLNTDIRDAASQSVAVAPGDRAEDRLELAHGQIGMTVWSSEEKECFFEALARLGRDDVAGISKRVRTKGPLEIQQYLQLLHDAMFTRRRSGLLRSLDMADFPAAVEVNEDCCRALEEAGDGIAVRQEQHEETVEQQRWGEGEWLIRYSNCRDLERVYGPQSRKAQKAGCADTSRRGQNDEIRSIDMFRIYEWLTLSERLFMNASVEEGNWRAISDEPPGIRTTALEDFYSLAVSLTKRLVVSATFIAMSRIRSKKAHQPATRNVVRKKDVEAAVASLGLQSSNEDFFVGCARRLRLAVFEEARPDDDDEEDDDREPMTFNDVEAALRAPDGLGPEKTDVSRKKASDAASQPTDDEEQEGEEDEEEEVVDFARLDADEILHYSAIGHPETTRAKESLLARVQAEKEQEVYGGLLDHRASVGEETRLWEMLHRQPPDPDVLVDRLTGTGALERPPPNRRGRLDAIYPGVAIEWRQGLRYVGEWETGAPVDVGATRKKLDEVAREAEEERAAKERRKKRKMAHRERSTKVKLSAKFVNSDED